MPHDGAQAVVVPPAGGQVIEAMGERIRILLDRDATGGTVGLYHMTVPPQAGPPPHWHEHEDEWFIPLSGAAEFRLDGAWVPVANFSVVYLPRGVAHTFRNAGDDDLELLVHVAPAGFEGFFAAAAPFFNQLAGPDFAGVGAVSESFGVHYVGH